MEKLLKAHPSFHIALLVCIEVNIMLHALNIKCSTSNYKWSTLKLNLNVYQYYIAIAIKELCGGYSIFTYISRYKYINNPGYIQISPVHFFFQFY